MTSDIDLEPGAVTRAGLRVVLTVLCLTQITSWGVLYYAFPVLATSITAETGWSTTATTSAFSLALVVSGLVGIPVGRHLDVHGPRRLMTAGSLLAALALAVIATAPNLPVFFLGWVVAGVAMAGTLYPPAFAALTRWHGENRVAALTTLTLVAGLASTVFAPLTAALSSAASWRATYAILAVVLLLVTAPAHFWGLRLPWPAPTGHPDPETDGHPGLIARSPAFLLLAASLCLTAFTMYAVVINLVPLLQSRGLGASEAAWALGLGGVGQVAGRLGYRRLAQATGLRTGTVLILLGTATTTLLLALVQGPLFWLVVLSVLAGTTRGIFTLLQATAVSDRWGARHFGRLNGLLSAPGTFAAAVAPAAGAGLAASAGGYPGAFLILAVLAGLAALLAVPATPSRTRVAQPS